MKNLESTWKNFVILPVIQFSPDRIKSGVTGNSSGVIGSVSFRLTKSLSHSGMSGSHILDTKDSGDSSHVWPLFEDIGTNEGGVITALAGLCEGLSLVGGSIAALRHTVDIQSDFLALILDRYRHSTAIATACAFVSEL